MTSIHLIIPVLASQAHSSQVREVNHKLQCKDYQLLPAVSNAFNPKDRILDTACHMIEQAFIEGTVGG